MARIAPISLPFNIKTLWFDAVDFELAVGQNVVVETQRGLELGVVNHKVFEASDEELKNLKSPLRPVLRIATDEDIEQAEKMEQLSREAMPVFRELAHETSEDMHPVTVAYMLDGDKAIFYFEAEDRIDFRDLVRKLAARFHVRIDMRQIGVRDETRIIGGVAHCGQEVCCKRLGGEFKPVSIRMAKDQDLSLNPQKISGLCGRLMCCLRYEDQSYKDFKALAPKKDAVVETPDGEGRVVNLDVPRETVSVQIEDAKPIRVPLPAFTVDPENRKYARVDAEEWNRAVQAAEEQIFDSVALIRMPKFTGQDKLGDAKAIHNPSSEKRASGNDASKQANSHRKSRNRSHSSSSDEVASNRTPRRRSIKLKAQGETEVVTGDKRQASTSKPEVAGAGKSKAHRSDRQNDNGDKKNKARSEKVALRPGHRSSGLSHGDDGKSANSGNSSKNSRHVDSQKRNQRNQKGQNAQKSQGNQKNQNAQKNQGSQSQDESNRKRRRRRSRSGGNGSSNAADNKEGNN